MDTAPEAPAPVAPEAPEEDPAFAAFLASQMADEAVMFASSTFPISPQDLIMRTKRILAAYNGGDDPALLASDFQFVAPVVGPLGKDAFLSAFTGFKLVDAFPDIKGNFYNFHVDPFQTNRVWYVSRITGTNTGPLPGGGALATTGKRVESPPQAQSMTFNEAGECTMLTIGYVMDKNIGNTGGLGGVFGIFYALGYGFPFPEAQPWQKSVQFSLVQQVGALGSEVNKLVSGLTGGGK